MNQERSHESKNCPPYFKDREVRRQKPSAQLARLSQTAQNSDKLSNSSQVNPLHQPFWFWLRHFSCSHFTRGLFWGGIISLTAVFSAMGGVMLTRIDAVERAIVNSLSPNVREAKLANQLTLSSPVNILLIEAEPEAEEIVEFSPASIGRSKTVILLKLQPQLDSAQAVYIPNDSRVNIPGVGRRTVQQAYKIGGTRLLSKVINQLIPDIQIKHYIRATPEIFQRLADSGKITLEDCAFRARNCSNQTDRVVRQQAALNTIRQRLNIPGYFASFETTLSKLESDLDADVSVGEIISWANFLKELQPENVNVDLLPGYTQSRPR